METSKFEIADYLDSKEMIAEYLNSVLEEGDNSDIIYHFTKNVISQWLDPVDMTYHTMVLMATLTI